MVRIILPCGKKYFTLCNKTKRYMKSQIGKKVTVKCPVYKNERRFTGTIAGLTAAGYKVIIEGNQKATSFAACWVTILN